MPNLISIVIPVYNVEKYLPKCLESILGQTYKNIEIIIVNDGSIDNSLEICKKYAINDIRINLIDQTNKGVSAARNAGIKVAEGSYLMFIDADDFLEANMVEILYKSIKTYDLVACGYDVLKYYSYKKAMPKLWEISNRDTLITPYEIANDFWNYYDKGIINSLWNKLYKADIIKKNNLLFPLGRSMGEDGYFNELYLMSINKIKIIPNKLYHYIRYPIQATNKPRLNQFEMATANFEMIEKFINNYNGFTNSKLHERHKYEFYVEIRKSVSFVAISNLKHDEKVLRIHNILNNTKSKSILNNLKEIYFEEKIFIELANTHRYRSLIIYFKLKNFKLINFVLKVKQRIFKGQTTYR